jgi:hypothetical protein
MRVFKTSWFSKAARRALVSDAELCEAVRNAADGKVVDLGGGVFKKRLGRNRYRSIILGRGGHLWFCVYLFSKQDQSNVSAADLAGFRTLAKTYAALSTESLARMISAGYLKEICRDEA